MISRNRVKTWLLRSSKVPRVHWLEIGLEISIEIFRLVNTYETRYFNEPC